MDDARSHAVSEVTQFLARSLIDDVNMMEICLILRFS